MKGLLRVSPVVLGIGREFGYVVDHNYINLLTVPMIEDPLQKLS